MRILLIETDTSRRAHISERLSSFDAEIVAVSDVENVLEASEHHNFALLICGSTVLRDQCLEGVKSCLRSKSQYAICVVDPADTASRNDAFAQGFDDTIAIDCVDAELAAKIQHARNLGMLHERIAQSQKLESIGELAAGIAHEINTPIQYVGDNTRFVRDACADMTAVLECCQRLVADIDAGKAAESASESLRSAMDDADVEYLIEEIPSAITQTLEGVDRVANIVRAMKEFAHPGVSEMTLTDLSVAIGNTVMVARNEWKYVAELETDFDNRLPLVPCLPGEFNQVILNMIVNASHAIADALGESPEKKGTITISTKATSGHAEIRVADSGSGISQENIGKIFTPFFTTKAAGKGTGQGLAIAHSVVVEKHGGTLSVESELGKGTTFVICIPLECRGVETDAASVSSDALQQVQV